MLELKQTQKLAQQLVLTPQLQQAIKLLQLSQMELIEAIEQEIKENPVLEVEEEQQEEGEAQKKEEMLEWLERYSPSEDFSTREDKEYPDYENIVKKGSNLRDYLTLAGRALRLLEGRKGLGRMDHRKHRRQRLPVVPRLRKSPRCRGLRWNPWKSS